jgi:isohexenylglutaconyl-CoA hydratase
VSEIEAVFDALASRSEIRIVVLRGAGGNFCAGGDIKDMAAARGQAREEGALDPLAVVNRRFGTMVAKVDRAPQAVVAVLEGAVLGGGFGLACVADVAIARSDAKFGLPETGLGVPPAQIAPFLVARLGRSQARRLAVTGGRFDGSTALSLGLVHEVCLDDDALQATLERTLQKILRCAPGAVATTKELVHRVGTEPLDRLLDDAAQAFARAARGEEGIEGMTAFLQKREPSWAVDRERS